MEPKLSKDECLTLSNLISATKNHKSDIEVDIERFEEIGESEIVKRFEIMEKYLNKTIKDGMKMGEKYNCTKIDKLPLTFGL